MGIKEVRDVLYCHLMDLEAEHPYTWNQDVWRVKQALQEVIHCLDSEMDYLRKNSAK